MLFMLLQIILLFITGILLVLGKGKGKGKGNGKGKGKAVPLQAWSGPEGSRKLK